MSMEHLKSRPAAPRTSERRAGDYNQAKAPAGGAEGPPDEWLVFLPTRELGSRIQIVRRALGFKACHYDQASLTEDHALEIVRTVNRPGDQALSTRCDAGRLDPLLKLAFRGLRFRARTDNELESSANPTPDIQMARHRA